MPKSTIDKPLIRELAKLLDETGLTEIEWKTDAVQVRVSRGAVPQAAAFHAPAPVGALAQGAVPAGEVSPDSHPGTVFSPMVGTIYTAAEPGASPFVKVGDTVKEGQTVMIVEAMKTMNPIPAPRAGRVASILITNEQPVEFGQPLLIID